LNKVMARSISVLALVIVLVSCIAQPTLNGFWQGTEEFGSIEFKATGEVIVVDNMSATLTGYYEIDNDGLIKFEFIASDILRESVQPMEKTVLRARIVELKGDELQLQFLGREGVESFRRLR